MKNWIYTVLISFLCIHCKHKSSTETITTLELKSLLKKDKIQLLDVRTPIETAQGSIDGALFVNYFYADFYEKAAEKLNVNQPVYIYCRSGKRSTKAAKILKEKGYEVYSILGGYNKWKTEN